MTTNEVKEALQSAEDVSITIGAAQAACLIHLQDKYFADKSFEWVLDECINTGRKTLELRKQQAAELQNARAFAKAVAEHPDNAVALAKKFGIGYGK